MTFLKIKFVVFMPINSILVITRSVLMVFMQSICVLCNIIKILNICMFIINIVLCSTYLFNNFTVPKINMYECCHNNNY